MSIFLTPDSWLLDSSSPRALFWPRAVLRIGAALEPEWRNGDPALVLQRTPDRDQVGAIRQILGSADPNVARAATLERRLTGTILAAGPRPLSSIRGGPPSEKVDPGALEKLRDEVASIRRDLAQINSEHYPLAVQEVARRNAEAQAGIERFNRVCRAIVARCADPHGAKTYWRGQDGKLTLIEPHLWNLAPTEWGSRFSSGQISVMEPMRDDPNGLRGWRSWLFMDANDLDRWLAELDPASIKPRLEPAERQPWHPLEKESRQKWIDRAEVQAEAARREQVRGGPGSDPSMGEVLCQIWDEAREGGNAITFATYWGRRRKHPG